ncbi:NepR family anti-sigma factor [Methylobacterium aquaticum]|jgi:hypothetical protein|uniref:NepR family anti-sigma factor n=1 Tax=Methylobacterium aquaticum TaxID=270351 RepID=UPI0012E17D01|nr:NepR family anti-sigma factor [Methylobacterium aquaticum]
MREDETEVDAPAGPEPRSRGRPGEGPDRPQKPGQAPGEAPGELDSFTRRRLGRALRAHYADLLSAPVPERFTALIAGLDAGLPPAPAVPAEDPGQEDAR